LPICLAIRTARTRVWLSSPSSTIRWTLQLYQMGLSILSSAPLLLLLMFLLLLLGAVGRTAPCNGDAANIEREIDSALVPFLALQGGNKSRQTSGADRCNCCYPVQPISCCGRCKGPTTT
jgi:hypothetical protein